MTQHPSVKVAQLPTIPSCYHVLLFQDALGDFIASVNNPGLTGNPLHMCRANTLILFCTVPVFHYIKFTGDSDSVESEAIIDAIHAWPEQRDSCGQIILSCFDTVLVQGKHGSQSESYLDLH
jgi:hypothetical protein